MVKISRNSEKKHITLLFCILGAITILVISIFVYNMFIRKEINALTDQSINQLMTNNVETYQLKFESNINLLESTASLLPVWDYLRYIDYDSDEYDYISNAFDYTMVINPNGYAVGSDGNIGDAYDQDYFKLAMEGKTVISELINTDHNNIKTIVISTPMIANGETRGVLAGLIYVETLNNMFVNPIEGISANLLVDAEGNIISNGVENSQFLPSENIFNVISENHLIETSEFDQLKIDIANGISGERKIDFNGEVNRIIYTPVGIENWAIVSIIPDSVIQSTTTNIIIVTAILSVFIVFVVCSLGYIINFSQRKHLKNIEELAYISPLTKINTLIKFKLDANRFVIKNAGKNFLLVKFDVENFRLVNESLGSATGDRILKCMAEATKNYLQESTIHAHIHSDEFLALIAHTNLDMQEWHKSYVDEVYKMLGEKLNYNLRIICGYYYIKEADIYDISSCIEKVNIAHHTAKEEKNLLSGYSGEYLAHAIKIKEIENNMESALQNGEFKMVLQPELDLHKGKMIAAEALVRWFSPSGMMAPNSFIPIFEQNGFILKLDIYIFEQACSYLKSWIDEGREPFVISVNFSRKHLYTVDFAKKLASLCKKYNILPKYLGIEVTETSMLSNEQALIELIHELHIEGFKIFMDDFGSGFSSLGLLKNTPVDVLKIDKSFFAETESPKRTFAVVNSVIRLSKDLEIKTVAEGIETLENLNMLKQMGCDIVQGYYYAKPMPVDEFKKFYDSKASTIQLD